MKHPISNFSCHARFCVLRFLSAALAVCLLCQSAYPAGVSQPQGLDAILNYISSAWDSLTRSMNDCQSVSDPKLKGASVLYLPARFPEPVAVQKLAADCNVHVDHLPIEIHHLGEIESNIQPPGLLYLENKYVVPGGRFNEMYGWDSYFIVRGLLRAGKLELAHGIVDNFFFEIEHYGAMLNANRTYYLTRSQPPFLSSMFVDVYQAMQQNGQTDREWLEKAYTDLSKDYEMWTRAPHLAGSTALSRYYDFGEGPPQEALQDESGSYRKIAAYFFFHPQQADGYLVPLGLGTSRPVGSPYTLQICDVSTITSPPGCEKPQEFSLSADYYKGDRSMRESGFDVSSRFGPFGSATHHFAPVCLNTLLYKTEVDMEQISRWRDRPDEAAKWRRRAEYRKKLVDRYLWDQQQGLFFDFDLRTGTMSSYKYATTFYPLWAGLATPEQAKAVDRHVKDFEHPGGLAMSTTDSGAQWDLPYGWGNIEMLAVEGLRRYGYNADADRISYEFLSMVDENFQRDGNIREKYNVVTRSSESSVELGYRMNVIGFGWTNAAFLELLHALPKELKEKLAQQQQNVTLTPPK